MNKISLKHKAGICLNLIVITAGFIFGFRYILSPEPLAYHMEVMNISTLNELQYGLRTMLMIFMKVAGLGMTTCSTALLIILVIIFKNRTMLAKGGFLFVFLVHYIPLNFNMFYLKFVMHANVPLFTGIAAVTAAVASFLLLIDFKKTENL